MSESKESSVLFNLKELMNLEEDRVKTEEDERRRREEEERRRREEEIRRRREEEEARLRAEEEARVEAERLAREEEERVLRERREHEVRVQMEMEARARAEEAERLHNQERALAEIEAKKRKGVPPWVFGVIALLVIGGGAGVYYGVIVPQREAQAALQRQIEEMHAEATEAQAALAAAQQSGASAEEIQRLQDELAQARANQAAAASGDTASIMRTRRTGGTSTSVRPTGGSTSSGGCMGPLCGIR